MVGKLIKSIITLLLLVVIVVGSIFLYNKFIKEALDQNLIDSIYKFSKDSNISIEVENSSGVDQYFIDTIIAKNSSYKLSLPTSSIKVGTIEGNTVLYNIKNKKSFKLRDQKVKIKSPHFKSLFLLNLDLNKCRLKYYDKFIESIDVEDTPITITLRKGTKNKYTNHTILAINNDVSSDSYTVNIYSGISKVKITPILRLSEKIEKLKPYSILKKNFYSNYECVIPKKENDLMIDFDTLNKSIINAKKKLF